MIRPTTSKAGDVAVDATAGEGTAVAAARADFQVAQKKRKAKEQEVS